MCYFNLRRWYTPKSKRGWIWVGILYLVLGGLFLFLTILMIIYKQLWLSDYGPEIFFGLFAGLFIFLGIIILIFSEKIAIRAQETWV